MEKDSEKGKARNGVFYTLISYWSCLQGIQGLETSGKVLSNENMRSVERDQHREYLD